MESIFVRAFALLFAPVSRFCLMGSAEDEVAFALFAAVFITFMIYAAICVLLGKAVYALGFKFIRFIKLENAYAYRRRFSKRCGGGVSRARIKI